MLEDCLENILMCCCEIAEGNPFTTAIVKQFYSSLFKGE
jgi:hypothetical protein